MRWILITAGLTLGGCTAAPGISLSSGNGLISGSSPAASDSANYEPQSANSLPLGAEGLQVSGPNGRHPNYVVASFPVF